MNRKPWTSHVAPLLAGALVATGIVVSANVASPAGEASAATTLAPTRDSAYPAPQVDPSAAPPETAPTF
jgi:hypothetical protein